LKWHAQWLHAARKWWMTLSFSPMDASRTDPVYLYKLIEEVLNAAQPRLMFRIPSGMLFPASSGT